jgi:hypothetical protein
MVALVALLFLVVVMFLITVMIVVWITCKHKHKCRTIWEPISNDCLNSSVGIGGDRRRLMEMNRDRWSLSDCKTKRLGVTKCYAVAECLSKRML